jgi:energy-coupling factor transporter transmembrane protein EcfT
VSRTGDTHGEPLAALDPRVKLGVLVLLSLVSAGASAGGLGLLAGFTVLPLAHASGSVRRKLPRLLMLSAPLLLLVLLARATALPGQPLLALGTVLVTHEGLADGVLVATRLALVSLWGLLFALTTPSEQLRAAIGWLLRPVPGVPAARIAALFGLAMRLLPLILEGARTTREAQLARAAGGGNPLRRAAQLTLPMMRRLFWQADQLALAMEARLYNDQRSGPPLRATTRDAWSLGLSVLVAGIVIWL